MRTEKHSRLKREEKELGKELYNQLRRLSCDQLWRVEASRFDKASPQERMQRVAVVRAVGVVFSESGTAEQKAQAKLWLRALLDDPNEKIRRYAMSAIPKIGADPSEESILLSLLKTTHSEREKKFIAETLEKIGGTATLSEIDKLAGGSFQQTEQKVKASLARAERPSVIKLDAVLTDFSQLRLHLRGRSGLEEIVRDEVAAYARKHGKFRIAEVRPGLVAITPIAPFTLADIYALRCFRSVSFVLGTARTADTSKFIETVASMITSPLSRRILKTFTEGSIRYRLDFMAKGHQRSVVRDLANRAYALCPEVLNDARHARWTIAIHPSEHGNSIELCPKLAPDPRLYYRLQDVPAASHPPLAACMARLAGHWDNDIVWDPFCGSGLELIERAMLGGVRTLYGTDLNPEAIAITDGNFAASNVKQVASRFVCCDFRDFATVEGLGPNAATLIITNPPMGKRVPIPNLRQLIQDLFSVAATVLRPGGRLVFANPFRMENPHPSLKLQYSRTVDFAGFDCRLEKYVKAPANADSHRVIC